MASLLQQDSTRLFQKLLRMFLNAFASLGIQPADVPYAIAVVRMNGTTNYQQIIKEPTS
jgi:hypothetical protein